METVGIVGCGTMGSGIAAAAARAGHEVVVRVLDEAHEAVGRERVRGALAGTSREDARIDEELARVSFVIEAAGLAGAGMVIEAVPEDLETKRAVFAELGEACREDAVLATNTSSLPVIALATASGRPERVVGLHFFNPPPVMKLVELVETVATAADASARARGFAEALGKSVVACRDRAGFIANVLLFPYINEAVRLLDQGYATREDIDTAMKLGAGHPMGPLELADLIGLDACMQVMQSLHAQFQEPRYLPSPAFRHLVTAGFTGRKAGRGFYTYDEPNSGRTVEDARGGSQREAAVPSREVGTVGVVGTGTVGAGVAEVAARAGFDVVAWGRSDASIERGRAAVERSTGKALEKGKLAEPDRDALLGRIRWTTDLGDLGQADLIVEAVAEDLDVKLGVFRDLGKVAADHAVLSTATSSLAVVDLAAASGRIDRVLGLHFFNPVPMMKLVEVVTTVGTSEEAVATAVAAVERMGKTWVPCGDRAGFIVNRLLFPYLNDAVRMHEDGYASPEDIDAAMTLGANHPIGPLALVDLVGLDVTLEILRALHRESGEPGFAPAPLLEHMVQAGFLGTKSGRGFRAGA